MLTRVNQQRNPPERTPAQEAARDLGSLQRDASALAKFLKALPKLDRYNDLISEKTLQCLRNDVNKALDELHDSLQDIRILLNKPQNH